MGTYENFYLNQIKQLQEENKKLKQIIDEGLVDVAGRVLSPGVLRALSKRDAAVVPGRIDPKVAETLRPKKEKRYASDDMESRRIQPGYGISSDSQGAGPKDEPLIKPEPERIYPFFRAKDELPIRKWDPSIKSTRRERKFLDDVDGYRF
jgi:hypothetical protein